MTDTDRLAHLLARDAIARVVQDLARGTDRLDAALIRSCYHPDAFDDHGAFQDDGDAFAAWVCEVLPHFEATTHFVAAPRIDLDGARAWSETTCVAHHVSAPDEHGIATDLVLGLRYVDRFEERDGVWKIALRTCAYDWTHTVRTPADQLFPYTEGYVRGRRDPTDISYTR